MEYIGFFIGFYGYLMIGTINLSVVELYNKKKWMYLLFFLSIALIFEWAYCAIIIKGLTYLILKQNITIWIKYITALLLFILSIWMWYSPQKKTAKVDINIVQRGLLNILIHPQQIPFWIFWGAIAYQKNWVHNNLFSIHLFSLYNALGAGITLILYAFIGNKILNYFNIQVNKTNKILAVVYAVIGFWMIF